MVEGISSSGLGDEHSFSAHAEKLVSSLPSILIGIGEDRNIQWWNAAAERTFGVSRDDVVGLLLNECKVPFETTAILAGILRCFKSGANQRVDDIAFTRTDGSDGFLGITVIPLRDEEGTRQGVILFGADITQRKLMQSQLVNAQKLEAIGQLAAGVAHEINTPLQYVGDNTRFVRDSVNNLNNILAAYGSFLTIVAENEKYQTEVGKIERKVDEIDLEYLGEELPEAIDQTLEGIEQISRIVTAMKIFTHPGGEAMSHVDINRVVENSLIITRGQWRNIADAETDFAPDLPTVPCLAGEINQVFLNILINATHAIQDKREQGNSPAMGTIKAATRIDGEMAEIRITDSGCGIPSEAQSKIFDPFFTTKDVGKGTGQGLSLAHNVIVDKHGGTIGFETERDKGTSFIIRLPLASP